MPRQCIWCQSLRDVPSAGDRVVLLVNNLGSTTALEMHGAAAAAACLVQTQLKASGPQALRSWQRSDCF